MKQISSLGNAILGDPEKVDSERYFITMICFVVSVFLIILGIVHLIMGLSLPSAFLAFGSALILLGLYFLVRFGKYLFYPKLIVTLLCLIGLDLGWYYKFLSFGPVLFFIFVFGALVIWFWDRKILAIMLTIYFLNIAALFLIEYTKPDLTFPYPNFKIRTIDIYLSFTIYAVLMIFILYMMKKDFKRQKEKAKRADKLKTAFLANMSHEIRTPMNAIYGFSKMLENETDPNQRQHYLKIIQRSSESLLKMINEVVDLSRIEAGYFNIEYKEFSVKEIFNDLKRIYGKILFDKGKTSVQLDFSISKKDVRILSDPNRVRQILINLVDNALKFTSEGSVKVSCTRRRKEVIFSVSDTGTGIPEEDQKNIFRRFIKFNYKGLNTEGSGIGLSIVEKIIRMLNGRIWFHSKWGEGTTFFFALPLPAEERSTDVLTERSGESTTEEAKPGKLILVVEDDPASIILISKLLQPLHYKIHLVKDGQAAVDFVKSHPQIDLILMDLKLPHMNGYSATQIIKKMHPEIPVIAQTAFAMPGDREKALKAGCDEYITKPINTRKLLDMITKYLSF
ncbi:MAG: response regulator [Chlorobi bacterium]|nr:response regulator [Chlorobiota bacterium]